MAEIAVWSAAVLAAWLASRLAARAGRLTAGASTLVTMWALAGAVMAGAWGGWWIEAASGTRVTFGQLRALEAAATALGARGVVLESAAVMPAAAALERLHMSGEPAAGAAAGDWLSLPYLPPGRYRLWAELSAAGAAEVSLLAGRSDGPFEAWTVAADGAGALSRDIVLPVALAGVRARVGDSARSAVRGLWIQPVLGEWARGPASGRRAASARRYGPVAVYAVRGAYLEPEGLWTAGGQAAEFVVQAVPGERLAAFTMRAGPVATPVSVRTGAFSLDAELAPGEERMLEIPLSPEGASVVMIDAGRGFRPSEIDPTSGDRRLLGVRLEARR
jgi:hypothetical protein